MNVRTIILILALFSLISTTTGGYLYYYSAQKSAVKEAGRELVQTADELKDDIDGLISVNQNEVRTMARFEQLQKAILNQDHASISQAEQILDHFAGGLLYDVCYLMDGSGTTIASSNPNARDSFVGHNYAFRPYFIDATKGKPGLYLAVGVTSGMRGIYFSHPVYLPEGGRPIGVVVAKASARDLDRVLSRGGMGVALLVHSSGIIFASSAENLTLKLLRRASPEELSKIAETQQFGKGPWNWSGFEEKAGNHVVDSSGEAYLMEEIGIGNLPGWRIVYLYSFRAISGKIVDPLVGKTGYVALFLCLLVGGAVVSLYLMAQKDILSRKESEDALKESERRLAQIIEFLPDATMVIDVQGKLIAWNQAMENLTGIEASSMLGKGDYEYALPFYGQRRPVMLDLVIQDDQEASSEYVYCREEGDKLISETYLPDFCGRGPTWLWNIAARLYDEYGRVVGAIEAIRDITERKRAEEQLQQSEENYRSLFEDSLDGIFITAVDGTLVNANQSFLDLFGYTKEEILGTNVIKLYANSEDRGRFQGDIEKNGFIKDYPLRLVKKDGAEMDCLFNATVRKASDGKILGYRGLIRDITDRKQMEEDLRHSEERYRSLVEDSFDGIYLHKGREIVFANNRLQEMLGYDADELKSMEHWMVYHPDYQEITRQRAIGRIKGDQVVDQYEVKMSRKDGSSFVGEILARAVKVNGEPGVQVWVRDISGRRRSEEAQRRLATAVEQSIEAVMITDRNGKIQYINPAFEHISGYRKEEVIGRDTRFLKNEGLDSSYYKEPLAAIRSGKPWKGRLVSQRKDGQIFYEDVAISPVRDSSGEIVSFVDVAHDVTENVELQIQLIQAQKMEAVGTLAGGIAHDFNNLLQVVLGYSEFMLQRKKESEPDYDGLQKIYQAGKRGADLVKNLLTFSRKVGTKYVAVNLNQEISQVQHLLSRTIPKTIKIDLHLSGDLESIKADPSQVGQILMNLGVNARDAMPDGGTLTIETASVQLDKEYCSSHLEAMPGSYVLLTVSDTGQGMDKKTLSHIFEPFFSTKEVGKGTGLGLATVYGIVKQHDGHIICYSEPGHGTTFKIYLPAIRTEQDLEATTFEMAIPGGTETILLVDDEESIRELGAELLNSFGYKVMTAGNGKEALETYRVEKDRIALILLDLIMPEMDGKKCLEEILQVDSNAKVIIASGYSEHGPAKGIMAAGAKGFIDKPFDMRELLEKIRKTIDED
ncbi:MAG: PAS domain S-box protein [Desulfomonilaceae bacterium]